MTLLLWTVYAPCMPMWALHTNLGPHSATEVHLVSELQGLHFSDCFFPKVYVVSFHFVETPFPISTFTK